MEMMRQRGVNVTIVGNGERIYLVHEREAEIPRFRGYVSVFSYGETCIVSEYGMKYGLVRYRLDNAYPLGVSNEYAEGSSCITISTRQGALVVVETIAD